jgi:hypothetical protein
MAKGAHDSAPDPRNASILISVNGALKPREEAVVSVFDSGFILGDGVWEGLRVHKGRILSTDRPSIATRSSTGRRKTPSATTTTTIGTARRPNSAR